MPVTMMDQRKRERNEYRPISIVSIIRQEAAEPIGVSVLNSLAFALAYIVVAGSRW
jgi:hypothetical protein